MQSVGFVFWLCLFRKVIAVCVTSPAPEANYRIRIENLQAAACMVVSFEEFGKSKYLAFTFR